MSVPSALLPTAIPAVVFLVWLPIFALVRGRYARGFFIVASLLTIVFVDGPIFALGLTSAALVGYALIEIAMTARAGRTVAFAIVVAVIHAAYWGSFWLPLPDAYAEAQLRRADRAAVFVLFSGIGLTFFRLMSYAWDRQRGAVGRASVGEFLAYMLFFPQFRHGPIERIGAFGPKLDAARANWSGRDVFIGVTRVALAIGLLRLFVYVASKMLPTGGGGAVNADVFAHPEQLTAWQVVLLFHAPPIVLYTLESNFASIQLGVSRVFGVVGTENFAFPFLAASPREVWRRWNITLSQWLREYVYLPLGGNRRHKYANIVLTFTYCGLLHALQFRCLIWGLFAGGSIALIEWVRDRFAREGEREAPHRSARLGVARVLAGLATYYWFSIGVIIIADPEYFGWRFLRRFIDVITGGMLTWVGIAPVAS